MCSTPTRRVVENISMVYYIYDLLQVLLKCWYRDYLKNTGETLPDFPQEKKKSENNKLITEHPLIG